MIPLALFSLACFLSLRTVTHDWVMRQRDHNASLKRQYAAIAVVKCGGSVDDVAEMHRETADGWRITREGLSLAPWMFLWASAAGCAWLAFVASIWG